MITRFRPLASALALSVAAPAALVTIGRIFVDLSLDAARGAHQSDINWPLWERTG